MHFKKILIRPRGVALGLLLVVPFATIGCSGLCELLLLLGYLLSGGAMSVESILAIQFGLGGSSELTAAAVSDPLLPPSWISAKAKSDDAHFRMALNRSDHGDVDVCLGVTPIAAEKHEQYVSRAELVLLRGKGAATSALGIDARLGAAPGFAVRAFDEHGPVGEWGWVDGADAVVLRIAQTGSSTTFYARAAAPVGTQAPWTLVHQVDAAPSPAAFRVGFGASDLRKGAGFAFHALGVTGVQLGGAAEQPIQQQIGAAIVEFDVAANELSSAEPDLDAIEACLDAAIDRLGAATDMVKEAATQDEFEAATQGKLAKNALKSCLGEAKAGASLTDKIAAGKSDNLGSLAKKIDKARSRAKLAIANLAGWKTKSSQVVDLAIADPPGA